MRKRSNPIEILLIALLLSPALIFVCRAEEQITITTYYPAPNGIYRQLRSNQMSIGSAYNATGLANGILIVENQIGIGTSTTGTPTGKFEIKMSGNTNDYFRVNDDVNVGLELRSGTSFGSPYIDFSDESGIDYAARIRLVRDGGTPYLKVEGGRLVNTIGCIRYTFTPTSLRQTCPAGTSIAQAPLTPIGTDGVFLCCNYVNNGTALAW